MEFQVSGDVLMGASGGGQGVPISTNPLQAVLNRSAVQSPEMLRVTEVGGACHGLAAQHFPFLVGKGNHLKGMVESLPGFVQGSNDFNPGQYPQGPVISSSGRHCVDVGSGGERREILVASIPSNEITGGIGGNGHPCRFHDRRDPTPGRHIFVAVGNAPHTPFRQLADAGQLVNPLLKAISVHSQSCDGSHGSTS
jgi:hypothetical protein